MHNLIPFSTFAHAFGQRYELPIPLALFVFGGAGVVLLSFLLVLKRKVKTQSGATNDNVHLAKLYLLPAIVSFLLLTASIWAGMSGSQTVSENILPTLFWLGVWIAIPLSCGLIGDWTQTLNPFANIAKLLDSKALRSKLLNRVESVKWPEWLGWWPAVFAFFVIACGELIFNQFATLPAIIASGLLIYFVASGFLGFVFGAAWLKQGEVFTVLFSTWGKLGFWRFGARGERGFAGGLTSSFADEPSRVAFVLLLLVTVSFDGLLATPAWAQLQKQLPASITPGTLAFQLLVTLAFIVLAGLIWTVFMAFSVAVNKAGQRKIQPLTSLAGLMTSLLPISFGYLLAHNLQYLLVNGQLLFPLIGNPIGKESWPLHPPFPFNDSFEPNINLLPSAFYWYLAVVVIIIVHIAAVIIAHRYLRSANTSQQNARRSEYPWIVLMIAYTMLSLWLLAQPLVKERSESSARTHNLRQNLS